MFTASGSLAEILALFLEHDSEFQQGARGKDESASQVLNWLSVTCSLDKNLLPAERLQKIIQHFGTEQAARDAIGAFLINPPKESGNQPAPLFHELSVQELFDRATAVWRKGGFVELAPSNEGLPEARVLCEALGLRSQESEPLLRTGLADRSPHVVAYCLLALEMALSPYLMQVPEALKNDTRRIPVIFGDFADKVNIGDFVRQLQEKLRKRAQTY
jgi:hypothetical protein